jgi:predicted kinase
VSAFPPSCVILIGIPASGKSSFFHDRFAETHVRINRDMLRSAHRERLLLDACIQGKTSFVVDKTNVTRAERAVYVQAARQAGFRVEGYFFQSRRAECAERNRLRQAARQVPDAAIGGMSGRLEVPNSDEGFDALYFVRLTTAGGFNVEDWKP